MSSMPTEIRTRPSVMPMAARRSAGTEACVIVAGCEMSVSTPPRLSASAISRTPFSTARARFERAQVEGEHAAEALHLARVRARAADGPAAPGSRRVRTFGCAREVLGDRLPVPVVRLPCGRASVLVPRSTSHESNGLRMAPAAFCTNFSHSMSSSRTAIDDAADAVAVAVQVLRRAVHDEVGAELDRPLQARARERVVDDQPDAVRVRERRGGRADR